MSPIAVVQYGPTGRWRVVAPDLGLTVKEFDTQREADEYVVSVSVPEEAPVAEAPVTAFPQVEPKKRGRK
jgi:hypothetical protein